MKRTIFFTAIFVVSLSASAFAGQLNPNQVTTCKDANSIDIQVVKTAPENNEKFGYTSNDRGSANLVVWKSSNYTTVPITLGPNDDHRSLTGKDKGRTGLSPMGTMGPSGVSLKKQPAFSRGDSIGDISGTVKITNTGAIPVTVACN